MQTEKHQRRVNNLRLQAYLAKLTPEQRRRADMAAKVKQYAKSLDLSLAQTGEIIRIISSLITFGINDNDAFKTAIASAEIMARINRASLLNRRLIDTLH